MNFPPHRAHPADVVPERLARRVGGRRRRRHRLSGSPISGAAGDSGSSHAVGARRQGGDLTAELRADRAVRISAAIIVRTAAGDYPAFSATCTHLACTVQYRAELQHIWCACHNGHYDLNGRNMFLFPLMRLSFGLTESPPPTQVSHRRVIVIWPLVNDPVHEFEPL